MNSLNPNDVKLYYFPITLDSSFQSLDITEDLNISKLENDDRKRLFGVEVFYDKLGYVTRIRNHEGAEIRKLEFDLDAPVAEASLIHANYIIRAKLSFNTRYKVVRLNEAIKLLRLSKSGMSRGFVTDEAIYINPESYWHKIKSFLDLKEDDKKEILEIMSKLEKSKNDKARLIIDLFCHAIRGEKSLSDSNRFLDLITILESLLNPTDNQELKFRVSLIAAKYFEKYYAGKPKDLFKEIKELYDIRSKIVHSGKKEQITDEKLISLCEHCRKIVRDYLLYPERFIDDQITNLLFD